ncbi:MAG: HlyD family type I secretion periplasmic adaptor subunit [Bacteroidetes bacterium]|nr:HlyD family type I secretion periplasmic adaptor subunit [Bacteroidota bacterium]
MKFRDTSSNLITKFIEHFPVLSTRPIFSGLVITFSFLAVFLLWGLLAPINSVAVTEGTIVLTSNTKIIQHLEGGIIKDILIKEGDFVDKGQKLIILDEISSNANLELLANQLRAEIATETRLLAEQNGLNSLKFGTEIFKNKNDLESKKIITTQTNLFNSNLASRTHRINILNQRISQFHEQIIGLEAQKKAAKDQLILLEKEKKIVDIMVHNGQEVQSRLLSLSRQIAETKEYIGSFISKISETKQEISQVELEILDFQTETQKEIALELSETEVQINDLRSRIIAAEDNLDRQVIKAEYAGIVTDLKFFAIGGTIPPHTDIMTVVPQNEKLIVETRLKPQDIDVVHLGLKTQVRLSAFKTRHTPLLTGEVIHVAAYKLIDPVDRLAYYVVRVKVDYLDKNNKYVFKNKELQLYPGMPAEVLIVTGKRTFIAYLLDPIKQTFRRSFKED